jgi:hypothetical protein
LMLISLVVLNGHAGAISYATWEGWMWKIVEVSRKADVLGIEDKMWKMRCGR